MLMSDCHSVEKAVNNLRLGRKFDLEINKEKSKVLNYGRKVEDRTDEGVTELIPP